MTAGGPGDGRADGGELPVQGSGIGGGSVQEDSASGSGGAGGLGGSGGPDDGATVPGGVAGPGGAAASGGLAGPDGTLAPVSGGQLVVRAQTAPSLVDRGGVVDSRPAAPVRRNARISKPARHPQWLVNQLPVGMLNSDFFVRFVSLFQELSGTLLDGADQLEHVPDTTVTPVPLLGYLASWIGAETVDASLPEQLQRLILRSSSKALAHRGTRRGLAGYLEMLSGGAAEVTDGGGVWVEGEAPGDVAWVRMTVEGTGHLSEDEFVALIRDEIPAHVRAELYVAGRRVLCTEDEK